MQYPAPVMENVHAQHFTNINATIPFFGPMMYFIIRALRCEKVLEIGHAEGYTAFYMANAVKDNGVRFGAKDNRYYGIDICQSEKVMNELEAKALPVTIVNMDSIKLTENTFKGEYFDLIFQDGAHDTQHVMHEIKTLWPQLKRGGYWLFHDCYGPAQEAWALLEPMLKKAQCEYVTLNDDVYGLAIIRKEGSL